MVEGPGLYNTGHPENPRWRCLDARIHGYIYIYMPCITIGVIDTYRESHPLAVPNVHELT